MHMDKIFLKKRITTLCITSSVIVWLAAFLAPDHYPPWKSFYNEFAAFCGLGFLLLYAILTTTKEALTIPRWAILLYPISLIPIAQYLFGLLYFSGDALITASYIFALALAIPVGFSLTRQHKTLFIVAICHVILAAAACSLFVALLQWLEIEAINFMIFRGDSPTRPGANLGQANNFATLLLLALASIFYLKLTDRVGNTLFILTIILMILGITITQSRTALIGFAFLIFWWLVKRSQVTALKKHSVFFGLTTALLFLAGSISVWSAAVSSTNQTDHPLPVQRSSDPIPETRLAMWTGLLNATYEKPWTGYGWNQVGVAHALTAENFPRSIMVTHSHNIAVDILVWNGIPIGLFLIFSIAYLGISRAIKSTTTESWFGILAIGMIGIHSLLEYPLEYAYFLIPFGLFAGLVEADHVEGNPVKISRMFLSIIFLFYTVTASFFLNEYLIEEQDHRLARFQTYKIGQHDSSQSNRSSTVFNQLGEDTAFMRAELHEKMQDSELEQIRKVAYRYPNFSNLFRYKLALLLNNQPQKAEAEFRRITNLYGVNGREEAIKNMRILSEARYPQIREIYKNW